MAGRYNPLNIDESKIVKKNSVDNTVQNTVQNIPVENKIEPIKNMEPEKVITENIEIKNTESEIIQPEVIQPIIEEEKEIDKNSNISKKGEEYLNIINEYIDKKGVLIRENLPNTKKDINNMLDETYKNKMPIYKINKNADGKVIIEPKKSGENKVEESKPGHKSEENLDIAHQEIIKMLEETERNIIRIKIELKIHLELFKNCSDPKIKSLYENKIKSFKQDLDYYSQRKSILERM